jgi:hypothetical protein
MAKNKNGSTRGFDAPGMETVGAKAVVRYSNGFFG